VKTALKAIPVIHLNSRKSILVENCLPSIRWRHLAPCKWLLIDWLIDWWTQSNNWLELSHDMLNRCHRERTYRYRPTMNNNCDNVMPLIVERFYTCDYTGLYNLLYIKGIRCACIYLIVIYAGQRVWSDVRIFWVFARRWHVTRWKAVADVDDANIKLDQPPVDGGETEW